MECHGASTGHQENALKCLLATRVRQIVHSGDDKWHVARVDIDVSSRAKSCETDQHGLGMSRTR